MTRHGPPHPEAAQTALNARFREKRERGDSWRILRAPGPIEGDCEDYALTLIWLLAGRSLWRFWWGLLSLRYVLWFCRVGGEGHMVLWVRGHGWTDNLTRHFAEHLPKTHRRKWPYLVPTIALKLWLGRRAR